jgi:hypothetical protein
MPPRKPKGPIAVLKKSGAGNLFMAFGEPDIEIRRQNGKVINHYGDEVLKVFKSPGD